MTISHKSERDGVVCGAHWKRIASTRRHPLISEMYWGHVTCKSCMKKRPTNTRNGEFLKVGTKIARLRHELLTIGAYQAMRFLDKAADVFHDDVAYIIKQRENNK